MRETVTGSNKHYMLRLFIAGATQRSMTAVRNVRQLCDEQLPGRYQLEVIDVYQHPAQARRDQIVATPTLVKVAPAPMRRYIGTLSNTERFVRGLNPD